MHSDARNAKSYILLICIRFVLRESAERWGGSDCLLVQFLPEYKVPLSELSLQLYTFYINLQTGLKNVSTHVM